MYEDLLAQGTNRLLSKLVGANAELITQLSSQYPQLPADYLAFIQALGWGEVGAAGFMLYEGLLTPDQVFDGSEGEALAGIVLFGDDFQGYCAGFDTAKGWTVVDIDPISHETQPVAASFSEFIRQLLHDLD
ncbi:SMI1/KNR4 family protein [Pseudomonas sp. UFMG81]|uniref:SMI1/KNR4 family protein n=1 Tax=Pseudomonas sp. UFMG81 TaxID=2745936 RepID=UPI00188F1000|nr:SMI1/KNR4 family protein [Pseudomonas sp. UFMG81]